MNRQIKNRIVRNLEYLSSKNSSNLEKMNDKLVLAEIDLKKISDKVVFPLESLISISEHYGVSLDDIIKRDFFELSKKEKDNVFHLQKMINEDDNFEIISIPFVSLAAAGSYLSSTEPKNFPELQLPRRLFPSYTINDYTAFEVEGDSMNPITHGSIIIAERMENYEDIKSDTKYVVILSGEILFKRLFWEENQQKVKTIKLVSDNKDHPTKYIDASEIRELWKPYQIIARPG